MMLTLLIAAILLPVVLVLWLRSHGAIAFMSLCLGSVLATYAAGDITDVLTEFMSLDVLSGAQWVRITLLVLPLALALVFTRHTVSGHKQFMNLLPALATGILLALMLAPLLPTDVQEQLESSDLWDTLSNLQTAVLLSGAFFSLFFLLITNRPAKAGGKKEK